jgi:hypothetical protein
MARKGDEEKRQARASSLMSRLDRYATTVEPDKTDPDYEDRLKEYKRAQMTAGQINAANIVLKKLVPDLSAVEQTIIDERDTMTEAQIFDQMKNLVNASPELAQQLKDMLGFNIIDVTPEPVRVSIPPPPRRPV